MRESFQGDPVSRVKDSMRFAELFAGAGGLSMGLERAGWECAWHAEIADAPRAILSHRWPDVPLYGDVMELDGTKLTAEHGPIDMLTGGSPCQDLSVAGKRAGLDGSRSSLFFQQMRLWDETGADLCLWENVDGARSSNDGQDFGAVLRAFVGAPIPVPSDGWRSAGVAAGPRGVAAWRVLDAQYFGVPQRRRRVFVLGTRTGSVDPAEVLSLSEGVRGDSAPSREAREVASSLPASGAGTARTGNERTECGLVVIAFGAQNSAAQGDSVSVSVTPSLDKSKTPAVIAYDTTQITSKANRSNPRPGDPCHPLAAGAHPLVAYSLGSHAGADTDVTNNSHASGGPTGFGISEELANTVRAGRIGAVCLTGEVTHALTHEGYDAGEDGTGRGTPIVANTLCANQSKGWDSDPSTNTFVVANSLRHKTHPTSAAGEEEVMVSAGIPRRLTPLECERLMGWPDLHTLVPDAKGKPLSDAARYKACGNGVASVHSHWIGWRLATVYAVGAREPGRVSDTGLRRHPDDETLTTGVAGEP